MVLADYINKNIISQAYLHVEPTAFNSEQDLELFKKELLEFVKTRVAFFLSPELQIEIDFEDGSLKTRVTVLGTVGLLFHGICNYSDFREGIQLLYNDSKRVTEYIISHATFHAGSRQENVIRLEARLGILGSIQKVLNQLDSIKRGTKGAMTAIEINKKIDDAIIELDKLLDNVNDENDRLFIKNGLCETIKDCSPVPIPPKDKTNTREAIFEYQRKRLTLIDKLATIQLTKT